MDSGEAITVCEAIISQQENQIETHQRVPGVAVHPEIGHQHNCGPEDHRRRPHRRGAGEGDRGVCEFTKTGILLLMLIYYKY